MTTAAELQRRTFELIQARQVSDLRDLYHPDYVYRGSDGIEQKGAEAGLAVAELYTTAFPDLAMEIVGQHAPSDDVAILEIVARGTHTGPLGDIPPTGKSVEVVVCNVVEAVDGKVHRERDYYDSLSMLQQLGVIPAEG